MGIFFSKERKNKSIIRQEFKNDAYQLHCSLTDKDNSATLLGMVDSSFLFAYAIGMFIR